MVTCGKFHVTEAESCVQMCSRITLQSKRKGQYANILYISQNEELKQLQIGT